MWYLFVNEIMALLLNYFSLVVCFANLLNNFWRFLVFQKNCRFTD